MMASYGGLEGIRPGLTKSTDHPCTDFGIPIGASSGSPTNLGPSSVLGHRHPSKTTAIQDFGLKDQKPESWNMTVPKRLEHIPLFGSTVFLRVQVPNYKVSTQNRNFYIPYS